MGERKPDAEPRALYVTTRDVDTPRTGADNRALYLLDGLDGTMTVDRVSFDRTSSGGSPATSTGMTVSYPRSELLAIFSIRMFVVVFRALRTEEYDVVVASGIGAVTYGMVASVLGRAPFVFDDHNVEYELARASSRPRFAAVFALERMACALAALVIVPTDATRTALVDWVRGEMAVVTNGYDAETFAPDGAAPTDDGLRLFYFGNYRYEPNVEAVEYIATTLCPRLADASVDAHVALAGPGYDRLPSAYVEPEPIEVLGFVEDLPATIRGADLVIVPLRTGSGSRLKIIESLACGTPVVSTPIGAQGWPTDWSNLVLADLDEFADRTIDLLDDPTFDHTEHEAYARYSWQTQSERFVCDVRSVVDAPT